MHDAAYEPAAWYVAGAALWLYCVLTNHPRGRAARAAYPLARAAWRVYCRFD